MVRITYMITDSKAKVSSITLILVAEFVIKLSQVVRKYTALNIHGTKHMLWHLDEHVSVWQSHNEHFQINHCKINDLVQYVKFLHTHTHTPHPTHTPHTHHTHTHTHTHTCIIIMYMQKSKNNCASSFISFYLCT